MIKSLRLKVRVITILGLLGVMLTGISVSAASSGSVYINSTYGRLIGNVGGYYGANEKCFNSSATTTNVVPRLRSKLTVHYTSNGSAIGSGENTGWIYNSKSAYSYDYEMHHFKNQLTGAYDGFIYTSLTAYGTADAITSTPYVVYTNYTL